MSISLKQALLFVPKNENWIRDIIVGGLVLFLPTFAYIFPGIRRMIFDPVNYFMLTLFLIFSAVIFFAVSGYFFKAVHNRVVHDKEGLPDIKYFSYYTYIGSKAFIGGIVFSIPFLLLTLLILTFTPLTLSKEIIPFLTIAAIMYVGYVFLYTMAALNFTFDFKISSFWNIEKAYEMIKGNIFNYIMLVLYCLLIGLVYIIAVSLLMNGQILALIIPFVSFYVFLVYADLFAQFIMNREKSVENDEKECTA